MNLILITVGCSSSNKATKDSFDFSFSNMKERQISSDVVNSEGIKGKVIAGYQGWFQAPADASDMNSWGHWTMHNKIPSPMCSKFDLFPDISEYQNTYVTGYRELPNGNKTVLFSSYDEQTVDTHFKWMNQYGIDGVAVQRFMYAFDEARTHYDQVLKNIQFSAEKYKRIFYLEYDFTGNKDADIAEKVINDFKRITETDMQLTSSNQYLKVNGKPVVELWGLGISGSCEHPPETCKNIINAFKSLGCYIIGGVPNAWNNGNSSEVLACFEDIFSSYDMINPWNVGRYKTIEDAKKYYKSTAISDIEKCHKSGQEYMPVIFPGFSWSNWYPNAQKQQNGIARKEGDFFWEQFKGAYNAGADAIFIAMFDEYDESTAIAKAATDSSMLPNQNSFFLTLSADGTYMSSDFYLRLANEMNDIFKGKKKMTDDITIPFSEGPIYLNTSFEKGYDVIFHNNNEFDDINGFDGTVKSVADEMSHTRKTSIKVSGVAQKKSNISISFLDRLNIPVKKGMKLSFWKYAADDGGLSVTLDIITTDGTRLSSTSAGKKESLLQEGISFGKVGEWNKCGYEFGKYIEGKNIQAISIKIAGAKERKINAYIDDLIIFE